LFKDSSAHLYLEMKGEPVGITLPLEVTKLIRKYKYTEQVIVESFDLAAITEIKRLAPGIRTAALFEPKLSRRFLSPSASSIVGAAKEVMADEVALHYTLAREQLIAEIREAGFEVVVWTVEDPMWISHARRLGIKALITNNPSALLEHR
jgi:glycerophosphoryl diester phosphodiesterase